MSADRGNDTRMSAEQQGHSTAVTPPSGPPFPRIALQIIGNNIKNLDYQGVSSNNNTILSLHELEASPEYAATEARFNELRAEATLGEPTDDLYTEFTVDKIRALFSERDFQATIR